MKNTIAIIGRPNVGKSTLFNKLIGNRKSIVDDNPGITRDRIYGQSNWKGQTFTIIDTGGIEIENRPFQDQIKIQAEIAINEADVIFFVVDGKTGVCLDDEEVLKLLRKSSKPLVLVANKLENNREFDLSLWTLGFEGIFPISAMHGEGVGDLLDKAFEYLNFEDDKIIESISRIAIIGRPNAGKSSLLNVLTNEERSIVSPIPNTTRDSVNSFFNIDNQTFEIVDTAGINKKSKLLESVDHYALSRAKKSISEAQIILLMIDAERDLAHFDAVVGGYADEKNKPTIIVINKWDLINKETNTMREMEKNIRKNFKYLAWAPIVFISAKNKQRIDKLKETIIEVYNNIHKQIKSSVINDVINDIQLMQPAPTFNNGQLQIVFAHQAQNSPIPTFICYCNNSKYLHFSYERYLENQFRESFGFIGTPIKLKFISRKDGEKYDH